MHPPGGGYSRAVVERDITADGVRSLVKQAGDERSSEAVVFVHGNPGPSDDWDQLLPEAGAIGRAVALDMPGYGRAQRPRRFDYTVAGYARHLGLCLVELGVARAHLVLHDFGGPWGLAWALAHPQAVASITLINIGIMPGYRWHRFARIWQTPIIGELFMLLSTRAALKAALNATNPKPFPEHFIDRLLSYRDWGQSRAVLKLYRASKRLDWLRFGSGENALPTQAPVLVLWGTEDPYVSSAYAERQKDYFADAQVHLLPGCGHWPMIDEPDRVAKLIVPFLRRQFASG